MFESILWGSLPLLMPFFLSGVLGSFDSASTISNELEVDFAFCEIYLSCDVKYEPFLRFSFELMLIMLDSLFFLFEESLISGIKVTSSSKSEKLMVSFMPLLGIGVFKLFYVVLFLASLLILCKLKELPADAFGEI